jgi:hypothetical protein
MKNVDDAYVFDYEGSFLTLIEKVQVSDNDVQERHLTSLEKLGKKSTASFSRRLFQLDATDYEVRITNYLIVFQYRLD